MINEKEIAELPYTLVLELKVNDFMGDASLFNMLSNYVGEYSKSLFEKQDRAENLVSTVLYELIGYVIGIAEPGGTVNVSFGKHKENMLFVLASVINKQSISRLNELKEQLQDNNAETRYLELLQNNECDLSLEGDFGLYMIANDYHAEIEINCDSETNNFEIRVSVSTEEI